MNAQNNDDITIGALPLMDPNSTAESWQFPASEEEENSWGSGSDSDEQDTDSLRVCEGVARSRSR